MIEVIKDGTTMSINKAMLNDTRLSSIFVEKKQTGRKYFTFYDGTVSISKGEGWWHYSMPYYEGHTLGFVIEKYHTTSIIGVRTDKWQQKAFHNGPGSGFTVSFDTDIDGAVGVILFMHPFADSATVQKYANAFNSAFPPGASQLTLDYNYNFLSNSGYNILPSFFNNYGITKDTCNEECFGMITVNSSPSAYDFITKSQVFR